MTLRTFATAAALALLLTVALFFALAGDRARHLPVPVPTAAAEPAAVAPAEPDLLPPCTLRERARAPGRVTALLETAAGELYAGTFDAGLHRAAPGAPLAEVPGLEGRSRFVNALAESSGRVVAGTQDGLLAVGPGGAAERLGDPGAVTALASAGGALHAGGPRGLFRVDPAGVVPVPVDTGGAPLRVNALAVSGATLWLGTPDGAWAVALEGGAPRPARFVPLVFGEPPARTNVVTALAPLPAGAAVAGTDDGGLVLLGPGGLAAARPLPERRANEIAPGALAAMGAEVAAGTQGGGLLLARVERGGLAVGTPELWPERQVTAVFARGDVLLAGTAEGAIYEVDCSPAGLASGSVGPK